MKIGYARVSTLLQNEARQLEALQDIGVDKLFIDKSSGSNTERENLNKMIEFAREGDTIYCLSIDRLARNTRDLHSLLCRLQDKGVKVHFIAQNLASGENLVSDMLITILGFVAQMELEISKERQREGIELAKKRGVYKGRKPKTISLEAYEAALINAKGNKTKCAKLLGVSRVWLYKWEKTHEIIKEIEPTRNVRDE